MTAAEFSRILWADPSGAACDIPAAGVGLQSRNDGPKKVGLTVQYSGFAAFGHPACSSRLGSEMFRERVEGDNGRPPCALMRI